MSAAALSAAGPGRDAFAPRRPGGMSQGLLLALVAHALLVAALAWSVRWKASPPEGVTAELWSALPQQQAPRETRVEPPVVEAKPPPRVEPPVVEARPLPPRVDPQIAIERERAQREREKREQERRALAEREAERRAETERERVAEAERRKKAEQAAKAEDQRLAAIREANLKRMMGQAGGSDSAVAPGTAARTSGPSASYAGRIKARIKPNIVLTGHVNGNPVAEVEVRLAPDGTIVGRRVTQSSGSPIWDETVLRAIDKTETLPRDVDGRVPPLIVMTFRPIE